MVQNWFWALLTQKLALKTWRELPMTYNGVYFDIILDKLFLGAVKKNSGDLTWNCPILDNYILNCNSTLM